MKALILAAGRGTRLRKYTEGLPKGILPFQGKSLIERQLEVYSQCGISDIGIVTGYQAEKIQFPGIHYFHNPHFSETNMVESLFCAEEFFCEGVIVSYADILFEPRLLEGIVNAPIDIGVTVDLDWKRYWEARYGSMDTDTESLHFDDQGKITSLGNSHPRLEEISARYVGLLKFTNEGIKALKTVYRKSRKKYWGKPWKHAPIFQKGYMTDLLQELIDEGHDVWAYKIRGGWLEFDTDGDFEIYQKWSTEGSLSRFISL